MRRRAVLVRVLAARSRPPLPLEGSGRQNAGTASSLPLTGTKHRSRRQPLQGRASVRQSGPTSCPTSRLTGDGRASSGAPRRWLARLTRTFGVKEQKIGKKRQAWPFSRPHNDPHRGAACRAHRRLLNAESLGLSNG